MSMCFQKIVTSKSFEPIRNLTMVTRVLNGRCKLYNLLNIELNIHQDNWILKGRYLIYSITQEISKYEINLEIYY